MSDPDHTRLTLDEFACLVEQHQQRLHAFLYEMLGTRDGAFDLVQDTFTEAWQVAQRGAPPFVPGAAEAEVRRWLFRAGYNNACSRLRRRRLIQWESLDTASSSMIADLEMPFDERLAEQDALSRALAQLAPSDLAILLLRVIHGFSAAEAGAILNTSPANVNNRLARAKGRLRILYLRADHSAEEGAIR